MANYWPAANGNWSNLSNWLTATGVTAGTLPTVLDDVYADSRTVIIDINATARQIATTTRAGGLAGGGFTINNSITLSANVLAGSTNCLTFAGAAPNFCTIVGNISSTTTTFERHGMINSSSGIVNVLGNVKGGLTGNSRGIINSLAGTINLVGTTEGGSGSSAHGILNSSTGTINVTGASIGTLITTGGGTQHGISNTSNGTVNLSGQVSAGTGFNSNGIGNISSGVVNVIGSVRAGGQSEGWGINNTGTFASISVLGNVFAGTGTNAHGIRNVAIASVSVSGNVFGGGGSDAYGVSSNVASRIVIFGNAFAGNGSNAYGAANTGTGYLEVNGIAVGNNFGLGSVGINSAPGIFGSQTGTTIIRGLSCGARGQWPTAGVIRIQPQSTSTASFETSAFQDITLITSLSDGVVPPVSSVRLGTIYNLGDYTGTCAMPSVSSVLQGVAVDNSVGIAALQPQTIWNYSVLSATDVDSLGGRLKEVAIVQSVGQQLTALS